MEVEGPNESVALRLNVYDSSEKVMSDKDIIGSAEFVLDELVKNLGMPFTRELRNKVCGCANAVTGVTIDVLVKYTRLLPLSGPPAHRRPPGAHGHHRDSRRQPVRAGAGRHTECPGDNAGGTYVHNSHARQN